MSKDIEYAISFAISFVAGLVLYLFSQEWELGLIVFLTLTIMVLVFRLRILNFRKVGIYEWAPKRGEYKGFRECLQTASASLDFLATWGGSIPSLSPYVERTFRELVQRGCRFRFLLLKPGSIGELKRSDAHGAWPTGQHEADIRWLLHIKESFGPQAANFRVALYDDIPIWAMVIVDNKQAIVGFYSEGAGRDNPALLVQQRKDGSSFFEAYRLEYDRVWAAAHELDTVADFETMLRHSGAVIGSGIVIAITGPAGSGKTTLCKELVEHGFGVPSTTVTTRPPRVGERDSGQYEYVSSDEFARLSDQGELLCETEFCGYRYGIRPNIVFDAIKSGKNLILDTIIPPRLVKERIGTHLTQIFLMPRTIHELSIRLKARGVTDAELQLRLQMAREQVEYARFCDYVVRSDNDSSVTGRILEGMVRSILKSYKQSGTLHPDEIEPYRSHIVFHEKGSFVHET